MSLLLDALRPESSAPAAEPEEEPLDAHATLELLAPKSAANELLTLEPHADTATETATVAPAEAIPDPVEEMARSPPVAVRSSLPPAEPVPEPGGAAQPNATRPTAPALDEAALGARRQRRYGLLLVALIVLAGIAVLGKSWWQPGANLVSYPQEPQSPSGAPIDATPAPASTQAVQVSSERPADQFAYTGNAPEIDLQANDASPIRASTANATSLASPRAESEPPPAAAFRARTAARPIRRTTSTLSVTRSQGLSPVDIHVEAGYRALAAGDTANAQIEYLAALELDPNNVDALMGAATVAARDGKPAVAAQRYATVLKLEPGNPDATAALSMLHQGAGTSESEESRLKILIATDGSRPALHAALAGVYAADGRWTEAAQEYFTALGRDPGNPDLAFNVAASLDQNRNAAMALTYYSQALEFARQRPAQIDLRAVQRRIEQLETTIKKIPPASGAP